jgi:hypothetical protein
MATSSVSSLPATTILEYTRTRIMRKAGMVMASESKKSDFRFLGGFPQAASSIIMTTAASCQHLLRTVMD